MDGLAIMRRGATALLCLFPVAGLAHDHDMRHDTRAAQGTTLGSDAAFGADGRLWVVTSDGKHVWLRHSDDFGKEFSAPVVVNQQAETISARGENRPAIALGPNSEVYVSWSHPLAQRWTSAVRFARSSDGGASFSAPVTVGGPAPTRSRAFQAMAVGADGEIIIAWIDNGVPGEGSAEGAVHRARYDYSWSRDGGRTFINAHSLTTRSCECCHLVLARQRDGRVATLFRAVFGENIRDHAFAVLPTDGQQASGQRATFSGWQVAACPEQGPDLSIGTDGVRNAVWYEASHGPTLWYGQLDPGHPVRYRRKLAGAGAGHASIASHENMVWVAWNRVDAEGFALELRISRDGGVHFGAPQILARAERAASAPQLLVHDGKAWAAWNTASGFRLVPVARSAGDAP